MIIWEVFAGREHKETDGFSGEVSAQYRYWIDATDDMYEALMEGRALIVRQRKALTAPKLHDGNPLLMEAE